MKNNYSLITILFFAISKIVFCQDFSDSWQGHFSYLEIKDVSQNDDVIYVASETAIFIFDTQTNEIEEITTINGLSGESIASIHYSVAYDLIIIGYENGLIDIVSNDPDDRVFTVIDIVEKPTIPANKKRINHFNEYNEFLYISTDYGISVFDLERLEFGDTYFIGPDGTQIEVNQTTVFNNFLYVATPTGIRKADLANDDLIDFQFWQPIIIPSNWEGIETVGDKLYALRSNKRLYEIINDNISIKFIYQDFGVDIRSTNNNLVVATLKEVFVYDESLNQLAYATVNDDFDTKFTCATTINSQKDILIGTKGVVNQGKTGFGLLKSPFNDPTNLEEIHPSGPLHNRVFSIETTPNNLWAVFGGYSLTYNFNGGVRKTGVSNFKNQEWNNIKYDTIKAEYGSGEFLSHIAINPFNPDQVFISSYFNGLIEINNNELGTLHNDTNSSLDALAGFFELTMSGTHDSNENLWVLNARVGNVLNKFENGQWEAFDFTSLINPETSNLGFSSIVQDAQGNFFIGSHSYGIIGFNENNNNPIIKSLVREDQGMPTDYVSSMILDNRNQLWVGTAKGLRVLFNPNSLLEEDSPEVNSIIILEDGIPQELLFGQYISDIEVDGSNNKWIGTADVGLFYLSQDGQETIFHFTKDNSPLPSNNIFDIAIDQDIGRVYIATDKGLVSFLSGSSKPQETLDSAFIFPNPVRPGYDAVDKKIKIKDISENVNIKITDIEGNLVAEAQSKTNLRNRGYNLEIDGGTAFWNGKNLVGTNVASGVYLIMLTDLDSLETKVLKLMVVR
jgi:hypothetical protein